MSKYGNHVIKNAFGRFDSSNEWARFVFLQERQKKGEISDLKRQVEFALLPPHYESVEVKLKTKTKLVKRCIERGVSYVADFTYTRDGELVVEDVKGASKRFSTQTADFKIKKKMMLHFYNIKVQIVTEPTQWGKSAKK